VAAIAGVLAAVAAVAIASSSGGGGEPASPAKHAKADKPASSSDETSTATETTTATETPAAEPAAATPPPAPAGTDGATLNDQGFAMINDGDPAGAVPVLQQAVDALEGSGDEQTYNYALYNLAHALRLSGRPEEAIPLLEQRLEYPDQTDTVEAELEAARQAAN
jgi:hypothetical protein